MQYCFYFILQKELSVQEKVEFDSVKDQEGTEG
jgi:hypothetical protein